MCQGSEGTNRVMNWSLYKSLDLRITLEGLGKDACGCWSGPDSHREICINFSETGNSLELVHMHTSSDEIPLDLRGTSFDPADIFDIDLGHFGASCCGGSDGLPQPQQQPIPQALPCASSAAPRTSSSPTDTVTVQVRKL